jgi:nucleoside-triphosphatase THEP1
MVSFITKTGEKNRAEAVIDLFTKTPGGAGFCSRGVQVDGSTVGYELMDLKSRKTALFAWLPEKLPDNWKEDLRHGKFSFSREGFAFAEEIIDLGLQEGAKVLFLDEVGKLELKGSGFATLLRRCLSSGADLVIGCRKANIEPIKSEFGIP